MKNNKNLLHTNQFEHYRELITDELRAVRIMLRHDWLWVLTAIVGVIFVLFLSKPLPPEKVVLAGGQPNSSIEVWAKRYQSYFNEAGVTLEIVPSNGAQENIELLEKGKVDVAISQGGLTTNNESITSLGSIGYLPLWLFYRGNAMEDDPNSFLSNAKTSINIPGSGTHFLIETLLKKHELVLEQHKNFIELSSAEGVSALLSGKIDAMALVAGMESGNAQKIIEDSSIRIFDFHMATAYANLIDYLEVVTLPKGSLDLNPVMPKRNITMPATSTVLLVNDDLHPAIQYLFLKASKDLNRRHKPFFNRPGGFPAYIDHSVPESTIAARFYEKGLFPLDHYLPFWLSSFMERIWFYLLAGLAIIYPLMRFSPRYRFVHFQLSINRAYVIMKSIEEQLDASSSLAEIQAQEVALDELTRSAKSLWVPEGGKEAYYQLLQNIGVVMDQIDRLKATRK
jgi:TRAP-type uncharacterized transport system substrate-binding protein